ncbi:kunitz-type trypsin inhibitor-like 2 protein [Vicia villosa]|uniref:kunitz-type trypsin inhibitor-like 2 protein n=1 Tax=Vicia villosa TaxID=3911 RepID=UPI00273BA5FC|nr:kunitz-type trypsin inhibitor-like 2 protein [Vicia villosa]
MKLPLITLSFFLFSYQITLSQDTDEQVKDTNGNPIFPGGKFYIMPAIFGSTGGGVRLGETNNSSCPTTVLQDYSEVIKGLPVQFQIPGISPGIIFTDITRLNIVFVEKPECVESSKWVVIRDGFSSFSIGIGGVEEYGDGTLKGLFSIKKHVFGYKLVFCPRYTAPPGVCHDIGRYDDENGRRLILTDNEPFEPFEVVLVDATESSI